MGMSASQARLLSITSRLHDVEFQAQNIEAQKIALATQRDELYQDYCDALKATSYKVKFKDGANTNFVDANYDSVCKYSKLRDKNYMLVDGKSGRALIDKDMADVYKQYSNNKYAFAYAMMGVTPDESIIESLNNTQSTKSDSNDTVNNEPKGHWETKTETVPGESHEYTYYVGDISAEIYLENHMNADQEEQGSRRTFSKDFSAEDMMTSERACLSAFYNEMDEQPGGGGACDWCIDGEPKINLHTETVTVKDPPTTKEVQVWVADESSDSDSTETSSKNNTNPKVTFAQVFTQLAEACGKKDAEFDLGEFNYYCQKWEAIQEAGGFKVLDKPYESGEDATKWFKSAVESGEVIIRGYGENGHKNEWSDTSFATSINGNYLQEMKDDTNEKKSEIEYEHELGLINQKDARFDTELSKLESERTALTTERDSIKKVITDNEERTFGIFS